MNVSFRSSQSTVQRAGAVFAALIFMSGAFGQADPSPAPKLVIPKFKNSQIVLASKELKQNPYLLAPTVVRVSDREVFINFKRGSSHGWEKEADCDLIRFDTVAHKIIEHRTIGHAPDRKFQLTIPVRLSNGDIHFYADYQTTGDDGRHYRDGMRFCTSTDQGKTLSAWKELGLINGVEYGYPLDFIIEGKTVYMLAMSFGYRPGGLWSIAVLKSEDNAQTWRFVRNISAELGGIRINESGFVRLGSDFIIVVRGYAGQRTRIARFDENFKLKKAADLTERCPAIRSYIGWPRVIAKDGAIYIAGRNWTEKPASKLTPRPAHFPGIEDNQQLCLIRVNPESLDVDQVAVLDNEGGLMPVIDGYYAAPYWEERDGETWFNTFTYRSIGLNTPDLVRLEYRWSEIR